MALLALGCFIAWPAAGQQPPALDICGCRNHPDSLGTVDLGDPSTYPPGLVITSSAFRFLEIRLPDSGVLIFDNLTVRPRPSDSGFLTVAFTRNPANTPVTILVSGNMTIGSTATLSVNGEVGVSATSDALGRGGRGGPGGFRGGDGAYQLVNFAAVGGTGLGPGGGTGGATAGQSGPNSNATFVGVTDLLPLVGGSGGGGGASTTGGPGCAGGGGGGGGGALLIAVNGTLAINREISANGGDRGIESNFSCASAGGGGSGGAIRLLANTLEGSATITARGGSNRAGVRAGAGAIRLEALTNNLAVSATDPLATRAPGPGPLANPITPTVTITSVGGQAVPAQPQGVFGAVDVVLNAPGPTAIDLSTSGVPTGTTVDVTVKPRVGGAPVTTTATLTNCDASATCLASVTFDLPAGSYFVEARATFQTP